jgi:hypothetical protein
VQRHIDFDRYSSHHRRVCSDHDFPGRASQPALTGVGAARREQEK